MSNKITPTQQQIQAYVQTPISMVAIERAGKTFVVSSIAISTDDAIAQCYGSNAASNAHLFATAGNTLRQRDELLAALTLLHAECRAGSPAMLTLEFAEKAIAIAHAAKGQS